VGLPARSSKAPPPRTASQRVDDGLIDDAQDGSLSTLRPMWTEVARARHEVARPVERSMIQTRGFARRERSSGVSP
jgi:hypothetical protein